MNVKGEFKLQSMLFGILFAFGLFFTVIASMISSLGGVYDTTSVNLSDLDNYSHLNSLSLRLAEQADVIDRDVTVNENVFDYLAGIFKKVLAPFKFIYKSYTTLFTVTDQAVTDLNLFPEFRIWAQAVLIVLVVIGIVMLTVYLKVRK